MKRSLIHLLIFAVLSMHLNANSNSWSEDRNNLNSINKVSRKIRGINANISQNYQTWNKNQKRAVLLWLMKDFIKQNLDLQVPFDEEADRGKVVYTRLATRIEEIKIADVLVDVSQTEIKLLIKRFENRGLISPNELQNELSQNIFIRQIDRTFLATDVGQYNCGSISVVDTSFSQENPKGSIAYAFLFMRVNLENVSTPMTDQQSNDLMVYLKTVMTLYHHEKNGRKLSRLHAEQIVSENNLPDQMKRDIQQSVNNSASPN